MANIKVTKTGKYTYRNSVLDLNRERKKLRTMQLMFALFSIILILSMLLSLVINS